MVIKTVILDRDGVINVDSDNFIKNTDEFIFLPHSLVALEKLAKNNIVLFITTNQSGIARKLFDLDNLFDMNKKLLNSLSSNFKKSLKAIFYCPHLENCACRKPLPGMINKIKAIYNIDLKTTAIIGDSLRDLEAGKAAGCKYNFLVRTGKGSEVYKKNISRFNTDNSFDDLNKCVDYILNNCL